MRIKKLNIKNFRSINDLSLDLDDQLNVFVGINGAGKTTILDAISNSLSWFVNRIQRSNANGNLINDSDIRYHSDYSSIKVFVESDSENLYNWKTVRLSKGKNVKEKSELVDSSKLASIYQEKFSKKQNMPIIAYYPVSRAVDGVSPEIKSNEEISVLDIYNNALSGKRNYQSFFEWFRIKDDIQNEKLNSIEEWTNTNKKWLFDSRNEIIDLFKEFYEENKSINLPFTDEIRYDEQFRLQPKNIITEIIENLKELLNDENKELIKIIDNFDMTLYYLEMYNSLGHDKNKKLDLIFQYINNSQNSFKKINSNLISNKVQSLFDEIFLFCISIFTLMINRQNRENIILELDKLNSQKLLFANFELYKKKLAELLNENHSYEEKYQHGKELFIVKEAIEKFIPEYKNLRVKRTPKPHMLIEKNGKEFNLNHMSEGEKNLISLVGDIARRLAIANSNSENPLEGKGIILIDEVDLHLHPSWQRIMIPQLTMIFPNCQFIISTHSPQVISHVNSKNLYLLENINNELSYLKPDYSYGKNSDRILEDILGVDARPTEEKRRLRRLYQMIEEGKLEEAEKEINELTKIIGVDPELSKAKLIIKRKQLIGK